MLGMRARIPKNFDLEERLERYSCAIERHPSSYAGRWAEACTPLGQEVAFREVRLDLGCGKGQFAVEAARREPDVLFVCLDAEPLCIAYAAQHAVEAELPNMVVAPAMGTQVVQFFGTHELSRIYINFPTPFPRKKESDRRLVSLERLLDYRKVLASDGSLIFKTDSQPLFDFALIQFELAGYELVWQSADARGERPDDPSSEYEERLSAQGACVYALEAVLGPEPQNPVQTASLSLADYLPQDLTDIGYVPHGMQGTVTNLRNRRIHEAERAARHS